MTTQQKAIKLAREALEPLGKLADGFDWMEDGNSNCCRFPKLKHARKAREALAALNVVKEPEPVYAFRRKGQYSFCTCDKARYLELSDKPNLFETTIFYTAQPTSEVM